jgi:drug/metabolite transporter (DMT)-like permease
VFGATANLMFLLATGVGQLTVAAILAGLYPAVTVALAAIVLHERIQRVQATGLIAAAAAVVLIVTAS